VVAELVAVTARAAVFVVFLVACVSKVRSRAAFAEFTESARAMVPALAGAPSLPVAVVVLEALVPVLVSVPRGAGAGLVLAAALLTAFSAAGLAAQARGRAAICRCFGARRPLSPAHHVRNGVLAAVAVIGAPVAGGPHAELSALVPAVTAGVALAVVLLVLDDLVPGDFAAPSTEEIR
jgi:hypothetical protein